MKLVFWHRFGLSVLCHGLLLVLALTTAVVVFSPQSTSAAGLKPVILPVTALQEAETPHLPLIQVQQRRGFNPFRGIFRALSGNNSRRRDRSRRQRPQRSQQRRSSRSGSSARQRAAATAPAIPKIQKDPNAAKVLVIGDLLAQGLAGGLVREFKDDPMIDVIARIERSAGLAANSSFNWQERLPGLMDEMEPHVVVVTLGLNDRIEITSGETTAVFGSPRWSSLYYERIAELVRLVRSRRLPIVWVGFGPAKDSSVSASLERINQRFRGAVVENGGAFIDIWRPFSDDAGNFSATGPDKQGQTKQLRADDGLTYTQDGYDKIAFFVGRPVRRFLGQMGVLFGVQDQDQSNGRVISLTRPKALPTTELAGEAQMTDAERRIEEERRKTQEATVAFALPALDETLADANTRAFKLLVGLVERGELPIVEGRVDAFRGVPTASLPERELDPAAQSPAGDEGTDSPFSVMPRTPSGELQPASSNGATNAAPSALIGQPSGRTRIQVAPRNTAPTRSQGREAPGLPGVQLR